MDFFVTPHPQTSSTDRIRRSQSRLQLQSPDSPTPPSLRVTHSLLPRTVNDISLNRYLTLSSSPLQVPSSRQVNATDTFSPVYVISRISPLANQFCMLPPYPIPRNKNHNPFLNPWAISNKSLSRILFDRVSIMCSAPASRVTCAIK